MSPEASELKGVTEPLHPTDRPVRELAPHAVRKAPAINTVDVATIVLDFDTVLAGSFTRQTRSPRL